MTAPGPSGGRGADPQLRIDGIARVVDDGLHNAFTDLCRFRGSFFLTYRACPDGHMIHATSRIVVLRSADAAGWREVHRFAVEGRDVRDPHLLVFQGRLHVFSGTWPVFPGRPNARDMANHRGYGCRTSDGETWTGPEFLEGTHGYYIWRAAVHGDLAFLNGRKRSPGDGDDIENWLLKSPDGATWEPFARIPGPGNETAFLFEADGTITALCRGADAGPAAVCRASPPHLQWSRAEMDRQVGGPLLARWAGRLLAGGRRTGSKGERITALYWLEENELRPAAILPSGGDNSYPGFVQTGEREGLLSYYSSHEGSGGNSPPSSIYLARLRIAES
jgi:hypothetical protein